MANKASARVRRAITALCTASRISRRLIHQYKQAIGTDEQDELCAQRQAALDALSLLSLSTPVRPLQR